MSSQLFLDPALCLAMFLNQHISQTIILFPMVPGAVPQDIHRPFFFKFARRLSLYVSSRLLHFLHCKVLRPVDIFISSSSSGALHCLQRLYFRLKKFLVLADSLHLFLQALQNVIAWSSFSRPQCMQRFFAALRSLHRLFLSRELSMIVCISYKLTKSTVKFRRCENVA